MKQNGKWWTHVCKDVGETQIPYGQPCNWCDMTEHDVMRKVIDEKQIRTKRKLYYISNS